MSGPRILVIRLGAFGDVIHALPAVASLKHSIPHSRITWIVEPKWSVLLQDNPYVDSVILFDRGTLGGLRTAWSRLRDPRLRFRGRFSRPDQVRFGGIRCARRSHLRVRLGSCARVDGIVVLFESRSAARLSCGGAQSRSGGRRRSVEPVATHSHCLPASPKIRYRLARSFWRVRWPVGAPSSGRSNTTRNSRSICAGATTAAGPERGTCNASAWRAGPCFGFARIDRCDTACNRGGRRRQRPTAPRGGSRKAWRRHLRPYRPRATRPVRSNHYRVTQSEGSHQLQTHVGAGFEHARYLAGASLECARTRTGTTGQSR